MFPIEGEEKICVCYISTILDYGDVVYQHAPFYLLSSLGALYHGALRFITNCKFTMHYNERVGRPPLRIRRTKHWHLLIYKDNIIHCVLKQIIISV